MNLDIRYTICFCVCGERVLLLHRRRPPHQSRWNGLGGKIEAGESPRESVGREVAEEAGIDLGQADEVCFAGVVAWHFVDDPIDSLTGMYAFVATFGRVSPVWTDRRATTEGDLAWKPIAWACDPTNSSVAANISNFLPPMLRSGIPMLYVCDYRGGELLKVGVEVLEEEHVP